MFTIVIFLLRTVFCNGTKFSWKLWTLVIAKVTAGLDCLVPSSFKSKESMKTCTWTCWKTMPFQNLKPPNEHNMPAGFCSSALELICKRVFEWNLPRALDGSWWAYKVAFKITRCYTVFFFVWGLVKNQVHKTQVSNINELKAKIREEFWNIFNEICQY